MSYNYDHRQLADEMGLFFLNENIGAGLPVWLPHGVALREALEKYIKRLERQEGYQYVVSPHIGKSSLYELSGHLEAFAENMFPAIKDEEGGCEYYLKPMNCPHHHKIFSSSLRSYRDLPLKIAEYGQIYRFENSGSLRGLSRVRGLCQNDAHIYIDPQYAKEEIKNVLRLHERCYRDLGLKGYQYRLSLHDENQMRGFLGDLGQWEKASRILQESLEELKLSYFSVKGEAAFYGPKIDVQMRLGGDKDESIASVQLDFNSSKKFGLEFVSSSGEKREPWVIHRAPLGSHERFIAVLLEYYDGLLPSWLAPIQVSLIPLCEESLIFAKRLHQIFLQQEIRAEIDQSSGSLSKRLLFVRKKRPFLRLVFGKKEMNSKVFCLESRNEKIEIPLPSLISEIQKRCRAPFPEAEVHNLEP